MCIKNQGYRVENAKQVPFMTERLGNKLLLLLLGNSVK